MSSAIETAIDRQTATYEKSMRKVAARQHVDLTEVRRMTKYVGRNIERMDDSVSAGLASITRLQAESGQELISINQNVGNLLTLTTLGFTLTIEQLRIVSGQLEHIAQILSNWDDARAAAKREKGLYLASKGQGQLATSHLQEAVELNVTDFVALYALGYLFSSNKQLEPSAEAFEECARYADSNHAMSAEAAILAAHCYDQLGDRHSAWRVLNRSLVRQCPDLALPLMKYAVSNSDITLARQQLATAFLADAELALTAEAMELDQIDEAAQEACRMLASQVRLLNGSWDKLCNAATEAGMTMTREKPAPPKRDRKSRTNLINLAMYRRRLQMSLTNMRDEVSNRLKQPLNEPSRPKEPKASDAFWHRMQLAAVFFVVGLLMIPIRQFDGTALVWLVVIVVLVHDTPSAIQLMRERKEYRHAVDRTKGELQSINAQIAQFESLRTTVEEACKLAKDTLAATIPPAVPRAFTGELVAYTDYRPHKF